jgi:5-methylcytosine-specific restriction endonuclease McrA
MCVEKSKSCSKCKSVKNLTEFSPDRRRPDGVQSACRKCNNELAKAIIRRQFLENPEEVKRKRREFYANNKELIKGRIYEYRRANPEKLKATMRRHYLKNRDKARQYQIANKPAAAAREAKRRAIKRNAKIVDQETITRWMFAWRKRPTVQCFWCGNKVRPRKAQADHIQPLAKGGVHEIGNMCVSCTKCNQSKHDKEVHAWNARLSQPILL